MIKKLNQFELLKSLSFIKYLNPLTVWSVHHNEVNFFPRPDKAARIKDKRQIEKWGNNFTQKVNTSILILASSVDSTFKTKAKILNIY